MRQRLDPSLSRTKMKIARAKSPGLHAAGEVTGHFYGTAPNAVAMLRATTFGKIAGQEAVNFLAGSGNHHG